MATEHQSQYATHSNQDPSRAVVESLQCFRATISRFSADLITNMKRISGAARRVAKAKSELNTIPPPSVFKLTSTPQLEENY
jgi:hypothetical protein